MDEAHRVSLSRRSAEFWGTGQHERRIGDFLFQIIDGTAPADEVEPHVHEDEHFIFVIRGTYVSSALGAPPVSCAPMLVHNPAGTAHRDHFLGQGGRFLAVSRPKARFREGNARAVRDCSLVSDMLRLVSELPLPDSGLAAEEIAITLFDHCSVESPERRPSWLDRSYQAVMEDRPGKLTLTGLAAEAGVHPAHLSRLFRRHFGMSAGEMLRARQVEQACRLLLDPDRSVAGIAHDLGFADQAHFTHMFRRRTGTTPARWRRDSRGSKSTRTGRLFR